MSYRQLSAGKEGDQNDEDKFGAERRKEVAEQEKALLDLVRVIDSRLKSESSGIRPEEKGFAFDARMDDDEAVNYNTYI